MNGFCRFTFQGGGDFGNSVGGMTEEGGFMCWGVRVLVTRGSNLVWKALEGVRWRMRCSIVRLCTHPF